MLSEKRLRARLPVGNLGREFHFYHTVDSTNDRAAELARGGAPEGTLVVAEEQTAGRGRGARRWFTPPASALALSLILRPRATAAVLSQLIAIGALAVVEALEAEGASAEIKWPNDVLMEGRKVSGVLVEGSWLGADLEFVVCGIGVNVGRASVPPEKEMDYPPTCVEAVVGRPADREDLLIAVVQGLARWYPALGSPQLREVWERRLAFKDQEIHVSTGQGGEEIRGWLRGLTDDGRLRLETAGGAVVLVGAEGTSVRPLGLRPG